MPNELGPNQFHSSLLFRCRINADGVPFLSGAQVIPTTFSPKTTDADGVVTPAKEIAHGSAEPVDMDGTEDGHPLAVVLAALDSASIIANGKYEGFIKEAQAVQVAAQKDAKAANKAQAAAKAAKSVSDEALVVKTQEATDLADVVAIHKVAAAADVNAMAALETKIQELGAEIGDLKRAAAARPV